MMIFNVGLPIPNPTYDTHHELILCFWHSETPIADSKTNTHLKLTLDAMYGMPHLPALRFDMAFLLLVERGISEHYQRERNAGSTVNPSKNIAPWHWFCKSFKRTV